METMGGQKWYQSIHYDVHSCRQVSFTLPQGPPSKPLKTFYVPLVMVSFGARQRTLAVKRVHHCWSTDTNFDPPQLPLDSTYNATYYKMLWESDIWLRLFIWTVSASIYRVTTGLYIFIQSWMMLHDVAFKVWEFRNLPRSAQLWDIRRRIF